MPDPKQDSPPSPWPAELDALIAAPRHHRVLFENERVRMVETRIQPGDTVPLHTHRWPGALHIQGWSDFLRRDEHGNVLFDSRKAGPPPEIPFFGWLEPLPPHTVENVGQFELRNITVEVKDGRS
jgi:hypothetical protein